MAAACPLFWVALGLCQKSLIGVAISCNYRVYGEENRISTLKDMKALRHLSITADAMVGRLVVPKTIHELDLSDFFPPKLETLTIREAAFVDPRGLSAAQRTAAYIDHMRAKAMFNVLEKIADVFIARDARSAHRQPLQKVILSAQYPTEMGKLAHWSVKERDRKKVWRVMDEECCIRWKRFGRSLGVQVLYLRLRWSLLWLGDRLLNAHMHFHVGDRELYRCCLVSDDMSTRKDMVPSWQ